MRASPGALLRLAADAFDEEPFKGGLGAEARAAVAELQAELGAAARETAERGEASRAEGGTKTAEVSGAAAAQAEEAAAHAAGVDGVRDDALAGRGDVRSLLAQQLAQHDALGDALPAGERVARVGDVAPIKKGGAQAAGRGRDSAPDLSLAVRVLPSCLRTGLPCIVD